MVILPNMPKKAAAFKAKAKVIAVSKEEDDDETEESDANSDDTESHSEVERVPVVHKSRPASKVVYTIDDSESDAELDEDESFMVEQE